MFISALNVIFSLYTYFFHKLFWHFIRWKIYTRLLTKSGQWICWSSDVKPMNLVWKAYRKPISMIHLSVAAGKIHKYPLCVLRCMDFGFIGDRWFRSWWKISRAIDYRIENTCHSWLYPNPVVQEWWNPPFSPCKWQRHQQIDPIGQKDSFYHLWPDPTTG